jgi:hypothetical protein
MKHILLFLLLLLAGLRAAQAQPTGSDSLSRKLTAVFAHLDKSQVPTGYLYDRALPQAAPHAFGPRAGNPELPACSTSRRPATGDGRRPMPA